MIVNYMLHRLIGTPIFITRFLQDGPIVLDVFLLLVRWSLWNLYQMR